MATGWYNKELQETNRQDLESATVASFWGLVILACQLKQFVQYRSLGPFACGRLQAQKPKLCKPRQAPTKVLLEITEKCDRANDDKLRR